MNLRVRLQVQDASFIAFRHPYIRYGAEALA